MSTSASRISRLQLVAVPSSDQERSIAFYEGLGFEKRLDVPWGQGHRWIELYPPRGEAGVALVPPGPEDPTAISTGILLNTDDIDATHAHLRALGVDVDPEVARVGGSVEIRIGAVETAEPVPSMFYLRDPDGNSLLVVEVPSDV